MSRMWTGRGWNRVLILESEGGGGKRTSLPPSTLASTIEEDIRTAGTEVVSLNDEERMVKVEDRGSA